MNQPVSSPALVQVHMTMTETHLDGKTYVFCRCGWQRLASAVDEARELGDAHLARANQP